MAGDDNHDLSWEDITTAISAEPLPLTPASRDKACLIVLAGGRLGEMVPIGPGLSIGRSSEADYCIPDDGISRIHLRVARLADGTVHLTDAESRNGTYVNGQRIKETELHDGDKIYIGTRAILRFSYADRLEEAFQQQMYDAALRDALTGLFNRRHLLTQLQTEFQFVQRHGASLAVVMFDLDHFKLVNDTHGHLVGDAVLRHFGDFLRGSIRSGDFGARYGGEEFVLVCRGIGAEGGMQVATRLQRQYRELQPVPDLPELRVSFSAGVAGAPDTRIAEAQALLRAADQALYQAKDTGRDRVCLFE
ncbi:MAG: GGDEF domain-containing protein [Proteobacteria bacterium]|nr:GGDEF domain-containing protein [Pseudomonadota bacterium]